jgi:hypothetical protein
VIVGYDSSPERVVAMLRKKGLKPVLVVGPKLPPNDNCVFLTFEQFERHNIECRRSYKVYHVCADPLALDRYNIPVSTLQVQTDCIPRIVPKKTITKALLTKAQEGSVFSDLMTHIYTLPSKHVQRPVTDLCCQYLNSNIDWATFEKEIGIKIQRESPRLVLLKIMQRPIADTLRLALTAVKDGMSIELSSQVHEVQLFEISYVLGNINKKENCTDKYVQNQGVE